MSHAPQGSRPSRAPLLLVTCGVALIAISALVVRSEPSVSARPESVSAPPIEVHDPVDELTRADILNARGKLVGPHSPNLPFSTAEYREYTELAGRSPNVIASFCKWDEPFRADAADAAYARGTIPFISWEGWASGAERDDPEFALHRVVAGEFDEYVHAFARDVADYGRPIILRYNHEMNGHWYPWGHEVSGNTPEQYAEAWRRVHTVFSHEAADNVIWVWSPNIVRALPDERHPLEAFYPGDDYVDYVGLTGYSVGEVTATELFQPSLDVIRTFTEKPILLGEVGAGGFTNKHRFVESIFEFVHVRDDVVGLIWFQTTTASGASGDWRFDDSPESIAAYAEGAARLDLLPVESPLAPRSGGSGL